MVDTVHMWSEGAQAQVDWNLALVDEVDEGGNASKVLRATYNDEVHRFSPNTSDAEIIDRVAEINALGG